MTPTPDRDPEFHDIRNKPGPRRRFVLLKILAGLAVLALVVIFFLPVSRSGNSQAARRAHCANNLKQIALALIAYEQQYHAFPPPYTTDAEGRPLHSWRTLILPLLDQEALYKTIDLSKPWNAPENAKAFKTGTSTYRCPESNAPHDTTTYLAVIAPSGFWKPGQPRRMKEITDGTSNTLMLIEAGDDNAVPWMASIDAGESTFLGFGPNTKLHHPGGMNAAMGDGSVKFLQAKIPFETRQALISISGNDDKPMSE